MSILEGQLALLAHQVTEDDEGGADTAEAVATSLGLFEIVRVMEQSPGQGKSAEAVRNLYGRWLEGATPILMHLRSQKESVSIVDRQKFMRAYLRATAITNPPETGIRPGIALDEVEREILNRG